MCLYRQKEIFGYMPRRWYIQVIWNLSYFCGTVTLISIVMHQFSLTLTVPERSQFPLAQQLLLSFRNLSYYDQYYSAKWTWYQSVIYAHRLALRIYERRFIVQWMVVNVVVTHSLSKCRGLISLMCSPTNGAILLPSSTKVQGPLWKWKQKDCQSQKLGRLRAGVPSQYYRSHALMN